MAKILQRRTSFVARFLTPFNQPPRSASRASRARPTLGWPCHPCPCSRREPRSGIPSNGHAIQTWIHTEKAAHFSTWPAALDHFRRVCCPLRLPSSGQRMIAFAVRCQRYFGEMHDANLCPLASRLATRKQPQPNEIAGLERQMGLRE